MTLCRWAVTAAALAFVVVSGVMTERVLLAVVSVAADTAKAALPVLILWLWTRKAWAQVSVAVVMLTVLIVVSLASGTGYAAAMRGVAIAKHEAKAEQAKRLKADLTSVERLLDAAAADRAVSVIDSEQRVLHLDRLWSSTKGCTEVTQLASRTFCASVRRLDFERASADERQRLVDQRDRLREQMGTDGDFDTTADASLQVAAVAEMLGLDVQRVRQGFSIATAVVLELGCVLLLLVVGGTIWSAAPSSSAAPVKVPAEATEAQPTRTETERQGNDHLYWQWLQRINSGSSNESWGDGEQGRRGRGVRASGTRTGETVADRAPARRRDA